MTRPNGLSLLAVAAVASIILLTYALIRERPVYEREKLGLLFPDLAQQIEKVDRLDVTFGLGLSGVQELSVEKLDGRWFLPARNYYAANQELINETLFNIASVEKLARRTALPTWHARLGLSAPENLGASIRFVARDRAGKALAAVLVGNREESEVEQKQPIYAVGVTEENFYARRDGEDQTWLARGRLPRNKDIAAWIDPNLPLPDLGTVEAVRFTGAENLRFPRDSDQGRTLLSALEALRPIDVAPATTLDMTQARLVGLELATGDLFSITSIATSSAFWVMFGADAQWIYKFDGTAQAAFVPPQAPVK